MNEREFIGLISQLGLRAYVYCRPLDDDTLDWSIRVRDQAPEKLTFVGLAALAACVAGWGALKSPFVGFAGGLMVLGATAEYWLGSRFHIGEEGASAKTGMSLSRMRWEEVQRVVFHPKGVLLSPLQGPGRMDAFRGVFLRTTEENRETVERLVRRFVTNNVRFDDGGTGPGGDRGADRESGIRDLEAQTRGPRHPRA
jgi:hypothetical protein